MFVAWGDNMSKTSKLQRPIRPDVELAMETEIRRMTLAYNLIHAVIIINYKNMGMDDVAISANKELSIVGQYKDVSKMKKEINRWCSPIMN